MPALAAAMSTESRRHVVKEVPHAKLWSDGTITISDVRASYLHAYTPYQGGDDDAKAKYGIVAMMPKRREYFPAKDLIRDVIRDLIRENKLKDLPPANKFIRDGDQSGKEQYEGYYTINASELKPPKLRHRERDPITGTARVLKGPADADVLYSGCWVNILIRPWFQNNKWGKKVNAGLVAVQFVRDDEPFAQGRVSDEQVDEAFDEYTDDASGFDDDLGAANDDL